MAPTSRMIMSRHCWIGIRLHSRVMRSSSPRPAWSCRISPACPALWILPPCVMRSRILGEILRSSTRRCSPTWSSTIPYRSTSTASPTRSNRTWTSNTSATANVTSSCVGVSRHSRTSAWYRRERASSTRSISNISPRSS